SAATAKSGSGLCATRPKLRNRSSATIATKDIAKALVLESDAERDPQSSWSGVRKSIDRIAEIRAVVPIHASDRRRRERVEGLILVWIRDWCPHRLIDARCHYGAAVTEDRRRAAPAQLVVVEHIQHLQLPKQLEATRALQRVVIARPNVCALLALRSER